MVDEGSSRIFAPLENPLGEGEVSIQDESEEDAADLKHATNVASPSAEVVERHRVTHYPYRSWCKQCVMGRGVGTPHTTSTSESSMPIVGMDYFYITKEGVKRRDELAKELSDEGEEAITKARAEGHVLQCLLVRCLQSKIVFAHVVPQKGDDEEHYCAKLAVADIEWLGHTKVIIKTDNERAIVALKHRVAKHLKEWKSMDSVQTESPAACESQSNGGIEVGIKIVRGLFRTLKLCFGSRLGKYISTTHALMPWLLQHTCTLLNATTRGPDGLTGWERIKGRKLNQLLL